MVNEHILRKRYRSVHASDLGRINRTTDRSRGYSNRNFEKPARFRNYSSVHSESRLSSNQCGHKDMNRLRGFVGKRCNFIQPNFKRSNHYHNSSWIPQYRQRRTWESRHECRRHSEYKKDQRHKQGKWGVKNESGRNLIQGNKNYSQYSDDERRSGGSEITASFNRRDGRKRYFSRTNSSREQVRRVCSGPRCHSLQRVWSEDGFMHGSRRREYLNNQITKYPNNQRGPRFLIIQDHRNCPQPRSSDGENDESTSSAVDPPFKCDCKKTYVKLVNSKKTRTCRIYRISRDRYHDEVHRCNREQYETGTKNNKRNESVKDVNKRSKFLVVQDHRKCRQAISTSAKKRGGGAPKSDEARLKYNCKSYRVRLLNSTRNINAHKNGRMPRYPYHHKLFTNNRYRLDKRTNKIKRSNNSDSVEVRSIFEEDRNYCQQQTVNERTVGSAETTVSDFKHNGSDRINMINSRRGNHAEIHNDSEPVDTTSLYVREYNNNKSEVQPSYNKRQSSHDSNDRNFSASLLVEENPRNEVSFGSILSNETRTQHFLADMIKTTPAGAVGSTMIHDKNNIENKGNQHDTDESCENLSSYYLIENEKNKLFDLLKQYRQNPENFIGHSDATCEDVTGKNDPVNIILPVVYFIDRKKKNITPKEVEQLRENIAFLISKKPVNEIMRCIIQMMYTGCNIQNAVNAIATEVRLSSRLPSIYLTY